MTHKYVYSVLFMLLSIALMPTVYATIMSYFFIASAFASLAGYLIGLPWINLCANGGVALSSLLLAAGLLIYHWQWT